MFLTLSKSIRLVFIEHSPEVIHWYITQQKCKHLPRWCNLLLPMPSSDIKYHIDAHAPRNPLGVVSGGAVCQIAFGSKWESDIDVFIETDGPEKRILINNIDHVYVNNIQDRISSFDLSICQVTTDDKHGVRCTPAFLYSLRYNTMIVYIQNIKIFYVGIKDRYVSRMFSELFEWHSEDNHDEYFFKCLLCRESLNHRSRTYDVEPILKWFLRLEKYAKRFPEMEILYLSLLMD